MESKFFVVIAIWICWEYCFYRGHMLRKICLENIHCGFVKSETTAGLQQARASREPNFIALSTG